MLDKQEINHESFAQIQISSPSSNCCNRDYFYGSDLQSYPTYKEITIFRSTMYIDDCGEVRYHNSNLPLIQIKLTPAQFVALLTEGQHKWGGVPCTLTEFNGKAVEQMSTKDIKTKSEFLKQATQDACGEVKVKVKDLRDKVSSLTTKLPKKTQEEINHLIWEIERIINDRIPFIETISIETHEKILANTLQEIDCYQQETYKKLGMHYVEEELKKITK